MNTKLVLSSVAAFAALASVAAPAACPCAANGGACACKPAYVVLPDTSGQKAWKMPFKLGLAGYTMCKKSLDETLAIMQSIDLHYLCVKDFHLTYTATDAEIAAFKAKCAKFGVTPAFAHFSLNAAISALVALSGRWKSFTQR